LNRGLSLSLPYFDDQSLEMRMRDFEIIPAGRIMFVPAFVVRASREESAKVAQDTRLDPATRRHLIDELELLGQSFEEPDVSGTGAAKVSSCPRQSTRNRAAAIPASARTTEAAIQ
jgi:hypothetical protein